ncbi:MULTISPECIES: hypothetical protein [Pseudomonadota]|uniref:hypothetical protein n=1 Tax=Rheinheimera sp. TaxID=1869214 RepID=UPI0040489CBB
MSTEISKIYLGDIGENPDHNTIMSVLAMLSKAREDFDKTLIKRLMKLEYENETLGNKYKKLKEYESQLLREKKEKTALEHNNRYCFITINPKDGTDFNEFKKQVEKAATRNMFSKVRYVYEQRGSTPEEAGKGFHVHLLAERNLNYKPSKVLSNLKNTFKSLVKVDNPHCLNFQNIGKDFALDKDEYIDGVKTGEGKDAKQSVDVIFRENHGLESIYGEKII